MSKHLPPSLQPRLPRFCRNCGSAWLLETPCRDDSLGWTECMECDWSRNHTSTVHHCKDCTWLKPDGPPDGLRVIGSGMPRHIEAEPYLEDRRREADGWVSTQTLNELLDDEPEYGCPRASRLVVAIALAGVAALLCLCWVVGAHPWSGTVPAVSAPAASVPVQQEQ